MQEKLCNENTVQMVCSLGDRSQSERVLLFVLPCVTHVDVGEREISTTVRNVEISGGT